MPDWIETLSTPVAVGVPVGVPVAELKRMHARASSRQFLGTTSLRFNVPGVYGISTSDPLPLIVNCGLLSVDAFVALKTNAVPSLGVATLTIDRNPAPCVTTQSEGSEPGCDG